MNFLEKIKHRDAGENGDLNQADFFFQVFYKLWLCGYSVLNVGSLGEGNGNPLQYSCLENPMDRGAW